VGQELGTGLDVDAHDTVPFCLWVAARHLDSYEEGIWTATSQDADRDTIVAIVGGIVVLAAGIDSIPVLWRAATEPLPELFRQ
jgi:ADP-ribosylglycohydrolase